MYYTKLGDKPFDELYIGGQTVSKMYYGEHQVWPAPITDFVFYAKVTGTYVAISNAQGTTSITWGDDEPIAISPDVSSIRTTTHAVNEYITVTLTGDYSEAPYPIGFSDLGVIEVISWPNTVTQIPRVGYAFGVGGNFYLKTIPDSWVGLEKVKDLTAIFDDCSNLTAIPTSGAGLDSIEYCEYAFDDCSGIVSDIYPMYLYLTTRAPLKSAGAHCFNCINAINYDLIPFPMNGKSSN